MALHKPPEEVLVEGEESLYRARGNQFDMVIHVQTILVGVYQLLW